MPSVRFVSFKAPFLALFFVSSVAVAKSGERVPENSRCDLRVETALASSFTDVALSGRVVCDEGGMVYPIVLSTDNAGKSWHQTILPRLGSSGGRLARVAKSSLVMLVSHVVEGPGEERVFVSHDKGKTWSVLAAIPKGSSPWLVSVQEAKFCSLQHWQIEISPDPRAGEKAPPVRIETKDGGKQWASMSAVENRVLGCGDAAAEDAYSATVETFGSGMIVVVREGFNGRALPRLPSKIQFQLGAMIRTSSTNQPSFVKEPSERK